MGTIMSIPEKESVFLYVIWREKKTFFNVVGLLNLIVRKYECVSEDGTSTLEMHVSSHAYVVISKQIESKFRTMGNAAPKGHKNLPTVVYVCRSRFRRKNLFGERVPKATF